MTVADLVVLRHGESMANVALPAADAAGLLEADITGRDADVPLSPAGRAQARAIGAWLASMPPERLPEVLLCSPYRRAVETLDIALSGLRRPPGRAPEVIIDERLCDRRTGVLELLTTAAVRQRFPEELARRRRLGEIHYSPEGGESMMDVAGRLSGLLDEVSGRYAGRRVMAMAHDAVVLMFRYVIEALSLDALRQIMASGPVRNASVTRWVGGPDGLRLCEYDQVVGG